MMSLQEASLLSSLQESEAKRINNGTKWVHFCSLQLAFVSPCSLTYSYKEETSLCLSCQSREDLFISLVGPRRKKLQEGVTEELWSSFYWLLINFKSSREDRAANGMAWASLLQSLRFGGLVIYSWSRENKFCLVFEAERHFPPFMASYPVTCLLTVVFSPFPTESCFPVIATHQLTT